MTKEQEAALLKTVADLNALLAQKQTVLTQEGVDKAIADALAKAHPPEKKMVFGKEDTETAEQRMASFGSFLKMVANGDPKLKTVMEVQTSAQGGYVVPTAFYTDIIYNVPSSAVAYPECDDIPMSAPVMNIPKRLTDVTIYWVEEDATKTLTKPTFERLTLTLKKMAAIIPYTDELLADNNVNLATKVAQWINDAIAAEKDRLVLVGNTGAGDVAMGVLYAVGVNATAQAGASMDFDDIISLTVSVPEAYQASAKYYMNLATLGICMKLKDTTGRPIWQPPATGIVPTILGKPYKLSGEIPSTLGGGGDESTILYGDFRKGIWLGHKDTGGLAVTVSNSAVTPATGELTQNAFMQDETWYRFVLRHAQTIIRSNILGKLTGVK